MSTGPLGAHVTPRQIALASSLALALGCGAPPRLDLDEAFRRIQVHEATIAHRSGEAEGCALEEPCPARGEICGAAEDICVIAAEVDDADALARCALARRRCATEAGP
jgi:hypothetical protein